MIKAKSGRTKRRLILDSKESGVTKCGLAAALQRMHAHGVLTTSVGEGTNRAVRARLAAPLQDLRATQSPYGPLIRKLPGGGDSTVEVASPHTYLYRLAKTSDDISDLLFDASVGGTKEVRIVLYMDSVCPWNPLRPDNSRTTECLYWTIVDFPDYVLSSSVGWFVFSTIRRSTIDDEPGAPADLLSLQDPTSAGPGLPPSMPPHGAPGTMNGGGSNAVGPGSVPDRGRNQLSGIGGPRQGPT